MNYVLDVYQGYVLGVLIAAWMEIRLERSFARASEKNADRALDAAQRACDLNTKALALNAELLQRVRGIPLW